jgi:hypothetical protein
MTAEAALFSRTGRERKIGRAAFIIYCAPAPASFAPLLRLRVNLQGHRALIQRQIKHASLFIQH